MFAEVADAMTQAETQRHADFVEKFKPKLTTDDCYTPPIVYDAIADWVAAEYGISRERFLRPFKPGGDYQREKYPDGCAVVDNPPFSILSSIVEWYARRGIPFFLFAPALTLFSARNADVTYLPIGVGIEYANGAKVPTSFITNMESEYRIRTIPELYRIIDDANDANLKAQKAPELPKYTYPDNIVTAAMAQRYSHYGVTFRVPKGECVRVSALDAQKTIGKAIFGGGYLMSERAAAERAAAERAAAERAAAVKFALSEREQRIVRSLAEQRGEHHD